MENSLQKENQWVRNFAQVLLVMNLIGAIAFYFAVPVYEAMKHLDHGWMTREVRTALSVLNILGAILVIKRYFYFGLAVLFVTGTVMFVHGIQMRSGFAVVFLFSYWDVMGLIALKLISHSAREHNMQTAKPSEADHG